MNNRVERENMDNYIVKHLEEIQKKLDKPQSMSIPQSTVAPAVQASSQEHTEARTSDDDLKPSIMPEFDQAVKTAQRNLAPLMQ